MCYWPLESPVFYRRGGFGLSSISAYRQSRPSMKTSKLESVIARLSQSKQDSERKFRAEGNRAGQWWARERAEAIELRRLEEVCGDAGFEGFGAYYSAYSAAEELYFAIQTADLRFGDEAADFWEGITGSRETPDTAYVDGFAAGAVEIWEQVKDKV